MTHKTWYEEEKKGHHLRPYSKEWLKIEKKEDHKAKIGTIAWRMEEEKEHEHKHIERLGVKNPLKVNPHKLRLFERRR